MTKADKVLGEIEKIATESPPHTMPIIGKEKGAVLENVSKKNQPKAVLEIGTLVGYSAILMAKNLKKGKIISIEINTKNASAAKLNIERAGLSNTVEVINGDALEIIPTLEGLFDLVFIDAKKEDYFKYLKVVEPKLTRNAIVVADNVKRFEIQMSDFLEYVRNSGKYKSETYDFGADAVEVSTKVRI